MVEKPAAKLAEKIKPVIFDPMDPSTFRKKKLEPLPEPVIENDPQITEAPKP